MVKRWASEFQSSQDFESLVLVLLNTILLVPLCILVIWANEYSFCIVSKFELIILSLTNQRLFKWSFSRCEHRGTQRLRDLPEVIQRGKKSQQDWNWDPSKPVSGEQTHPPYFHSKGQPLNEWLCLVPAFISHKHYFIVT